MWPSTRRESVLLHIAVCKHLLPSTEGQVTQFYTQTYHKRLVYNHALVFARMWPIGKSPGKIIIDLLMRKVTTWNIIIKNIEFLV